MQDETNCFQVTRLVLIPLLLLTAPAGGASAQQTVVSKTAAGTAASAYLNGMGRLQAAPEDCDTADAAPDSCSAATPQELVAGQTVQAVRSSGFLQLDSIGADQPLQTAGDDAGLEKLFQLGKGTEWRIAGGEAEGSNQVGVFASQQLWQAGSTATVKFDAGVIAESKTGSAAGLAGLALNW
jgi:hypothetical protein